MFCSNCGKEVNENQAICLHCGVELKKQVKDKGGFLYGLIGAIVPIVGFILFLIWRDDRPKTSKALGIGAAIGIVLQVIYTIVYFVFFFRYLI